MLTNILQRTCKTFCNYGLIMFSREAHVFDRGILKTKDRCHFPKPKEVMRIRKHGWEARMSTGGGRRVLMRRILKGCYVLSH